MKVKLAQLYESKSNPKQPPYVVVWLEDGKLMCNCKGWTIYKNKPRSCTHCEQFAKEHKLMLWGEGDYVFAEE